MPWQWKQDSVNMNTCCVPRLGRSTATLPSSTSMRPLGVCSFSRPCASALLFFFLLLYVLSLFHYLLLPPAFHSTFPFICPIISSSLFYKLRWEVGLQEITWVLTHSLFITTHRRTKLTSNIISPRAIHNITMYPYLAWTTFIDQTSTNLTETHLLLPSDCWAWRHASPHRACLHLFWGQRQCQKWLDLTMHGTGQL